MAKQICMITTDSMKPILYAAYNDLPNKYNVRLRT